MLNLEKLMRKAVVAIVLSILLSACASEVPSIQTTGMGVYNGESLKIEITDTPNANELFSHLKSTITFNDELVTEIIWDTDLESGKRGEGLLADQYITALRTYKGKELKVVRVLDLTSIVSRPITKYEFYIENKLIGVVVAPV
jgi:hypothetical protein